MDLRANKTRESIPISKVASTELPKLFWAFRTQLRLTCGVSDALWPSFTLVIHSFQEKMKPNSLLI